MLDHVGLHSALRLVVRHCHSHNLLAHSLLLEHKHPGRPLSGQDGALVLYRRIAYRYRPRNHRPTDASSRIATTAAKTEVVADAGFRYWGLV